MFKDKSLLGNFWNIENSFEREVLTLSQNTNINPLLAKLLLIRNIKSDSIDEFLNPNINKYNVPNPFQLKDMEKAVNRVVEAIMNNQKIGIVADYDVDGSTSAAILVKFLSNFKNKIILKIPNRLTEGYGPNIRIMEEMNNSNIDLLFTLDCGTSSSNIIDKEKYSNIDIIIIDHHLSESLLPKVHSIINPNRFDEDSDFHEMAAVGVTFLFLLALRKKLRISNYFTDTIEPNLFSYLDLVALGTVCDVVELVNYNRKFVKIGLDLIKKRKNLGLTKIIDNSNINSTPNSGDLGFVIGPQLNAASRIDDSSLPSKLLISQNIEEVESISRKLILLNEKRKLIENLVYDEAILQAQKQIDQKFIIVYGHEWHHGVLGIVASRLINKFYKPTIVISFNNNVGIGSARSIKSIDLGNFILNAKNKGILIGGGGHKMAAGLQIKYTEIKNFIEFLNISMNKININLFKKIENFDSEISVNEINDDLLEVIDKLEPFGSGNHEPKFIIKDLKIDSVQIIKDKHILIFFQNDFSSSLKAICFNCIGTVLGDYLLNFRNKKLLIGCSIRRDNFNDTSMPQIIIKDAIITN